MGFRGATLPLGDGSVTVGDHRIELTKNEFRILSTLLGNRGKIVSRDALMLRLRNDDCYVEENTLTVNVTRLRRKLESIGLRDVIVTKPGGGYMESVIRAPWQTKRTRLSANSAEPSAITPPGDRIGAS